VTTARHLRYESALHNSNRRLAFKLTRDFARLDLRDLDASWPTYAQAAGFSVRSEWNVSVHEALVYLFGLLLDAQNMPSEPPLLRAFNPGQVRSILRLAGPIRIKRLIAAGYDQQAALLEGLRNTVSYTAGHDIEEANLQVQESSEAKNDDGGKVVQGYSRQVEPGACPFCRRLAGATQHIGLVYNVTTKWRTPHPYCKCTIIPEPVYRWQRFQSTEDMALSAQMYASIVRERDTALREAHSGLIAA
jgi:hypothetical protein